MRAARIALLLLVVGLVSAPPAAADVTIGSDLPPPSGATFACASCTFAPRALAAGNVSAPSAGVITRWRVRSGTGPLPTVRLQVIRGPAGGQAVEIAHSAEATPTPGAITEFQARLPVATGDRVGLWTDGAAQFFAEPVGSSLDVWDPALTPAPATPQGIDPGEVLVNADVEPDVDADESGDETQDNCVGVANLGQADRDHDGRGDACDVCPDAFGAQANGCPVPATPPPNRPPTVRFRTPMAGTAIGTSFRIQLDVADDRGSPTVSVFDDDGTICVLRRAPYACTWTPTGADVGRATLLASAVDSAGLSTLGIVRVRVSRFTASLTQRQRHRKGVTRVTGRLVLPATVTRAQGCTGTVKVRLRKARRTATLTRRCTYSARLPFRPGRARVSFGGNAVIAPT
jgi:Bacterial Ig domain